MLAIFKPINLRMDTRDILERFFEKYMTPDMVVYDIGCGEKPFKLNVKEHIGIDVDGGFYDTSHLDVVAEAYDIPLGNETADAAISAQVLEHLERPEDAIRETHRLLKPGGFFFISVPFMVPIHAEPYDFSRMTEFQLTRYLKESGFKILELKKVGGFWYLTGMLLGLYLQPIDRGIFKKLKISTALLWFIRWFFRMVHLLEGFVLKLAKRDVENVRMKWAVNYMIVAQKIV